jgi:hypothetical protein
MEYFENLGVQFLGQSPYFVAWLVAIVFAIIMMSRGGGRAEKLFLAGTILMFFTRLIYPFLSVLSIYLMHLMHEQRMTVTQFGLIYSLTTGLISLAGLICLVVAFWLKFNSKKADNQGASNPDDN